MFIQKFSESQSSISMIVDEIIMQLNSNQIDQLIIDLITQTKIHLTDKNECAQCGKPINLECRKRQTIERAGLSLIERIPSENHNLEDKKRIVGAWFRDNFWIIEAECLRCSHLWDKEEITDGYEERLQDHLIEGKKKWKNKNLKIE